MKFSRVEPPIRIRWIRKAFGDQKIVYQLAGQTAGQKKWTGYQHSATCATLMPPPPGSYRAAAQREASVGRTTSVDVVMSSAGAMHRVTMSTVNIFMADTLYQPGRVGLRIRPATHTLVGPSGSRYGWSRCDHRVELVGRPHTWK